jgi:ketosteroid isomerase-like protein
MSFVSKFTLASGAVLAVFAASAAMVSRATAQKLEGLPNAGSVANLTNAQPRQADVTDDETEVAMLDRAWADAVPRRDTAAINRILADDFTGIDPAANTFTKTSYVHELSEGAFSNDRIGLDEVRPRVFGDVAVVTSLIKLNGAPTGGRMTNVYVKRQGRWKCVSSHASGRTESFGVVPAPGFGPETIRAARPKAAIIRLWFPCRVEDVFVKLGQIVKPGERLLSVRSEEMAAAKIRMRKALAEGERNKKLLDALSRNRESAPSEEKAELDQAQSRLDDQLHMDAAFLRRFVGGGSNYRPYADPHEDSRLTIQSGIPGPVTGIGAARGKDYNEDSVLIVIESAPAAKPQAP